MELLLSSLFISKIVRNKTEVIDISLDLTSDSSILL